MTAPVVPPGLGERARTFWDSSLSVKPDPNPAEVVLLVEACRLIDRSDRYEALLQGDSAMWCRIDWPYEDSPATLVISSLIQEARQTVAELRQVTKALALPASAVKKEEKPAGLALIRDRSA